MLLRVQKLIQRGGNQKADEPALAAYTFGKCSVNFDSFEIKDAKGEAKQLSQREIMLLKLLIDRKNEVVSQRRDFREGLGL